MTTDRFSADDVPPGSIGYTLVSTAERLWRLSCEGNYVDAYENEFDVVGSALPPRGVVVPSLTGGWLDVHPYHQLAVTSPAFATAISRFGRQPGKEDFFGHLQLVTPGDGTGFPVLWDRERQLKLVYFLDIADRITGGFPEEYRLDWPDSDLKIDGLVTVDESRGSWARKAAEVTVTLRNPFGDERTVSADFIVPAYTCDRASRGLVDLFPAVTTDDMDWD
ncbi:MAG TPA: hypothetical protein VH281_05295 [Gaiellaceae bacterium]